MVANMKIQDQPAQDTSAGYTDPIKEKRDDLERRIENTNLAKSIDKTILNKIAQAVIKGFNIDKESRDQWEEDNEASIKLATQVIEAKSEPFDGCANIKYPLLSIASVQFASRAFSQVIQSGNVIKGRVVGEDPEGQKAGRAQRVSTHMNYQLTDQMEEWEDDTDNLLCALPIEGCEFKKTYHSKNLGRNVSEWIRPTELVVHYKAKTLEKASKYTHIIYLRPNDITERVRTGLFLDLKEFEQPPNFDEESRSDPEDDDAPHTFYEQSCYYDLDDDGYKEPIIVTVHKDSKKIVRIVARFDIDDVEFNEKGQVARIKPVHYITRFVFMPSPDGGIYGMGYGRLLSPINMSINMGLNQLLDSGTLSNTQGGFIGKVVSMMKGRGSGDVKFKMGEFKQLTYSGDDIRKSIMALPFKEPSIVLFRLLELLINAGEKLGNVVDPLVGESPGANVPATTTLALIEQGMKVYSAIYKRLHRALKSEFKKLFRLNKLYLDQVDYFYINDNQQAIARNDYNPEDCDVTLVSDPNEISSTQKLLTAEALTTMLGMGLNDDEIKRRKLEALQVPDIDKIIPEDGSEPPPDPKVVIETQKLDMERDRLELDMFMAKFEMLKLQADSIKSIAQAEGVEIGQQLELYQSNLKAMTESMKVRSQKKNGSGNKG